MADKTVPKRALILAGGGVKVAFQAGVLQVLLDEAEGLEWHHVDGASGGSFNLAMLCQGMSGREIADNWRRLDPLAVPAVNPRLVLGESIATLRRMRDNVFPFWGLDFEAIRASTLNATFNVYDFTRHELEVLRPAAMTPEMLMACVSLPMWFPPVRQAGRVYIDPVYISDANLEQAIDEGADELWVIWTVSRRARWRRGFINHYFQVIETSAYGHLKRVLARIEASNRAHADGGHPEFDRPIEVKMLSAEVPLHYLLNATRAQFRRAVDAGVGAGREWCRREGIPLRAPERQPTASPRPARVWFTEEMAGWAKIGEHEPRAGGDAGRVAGARLKFHLTISVDDLDAFLADRLREAPAQGWIECEELGGRRPVQRGRFNLFIAADDPRMKLMRYRLLFSDGEGRPLTLAGVKHVRDEPGADAWADTTTLYVRLLDGHVDELEPDGPVVGAGVLRISPAAFARQLTTFRGRGFGAAGDARAVARFARAFAGELVSVYAARAPLGRPGAGATRG